MISKYRWLYQLGLQGPDIFFYNLPILRHRDYRNVGTHMHESHVNLFFRNYLEELISKDDYAAYTRELEADIISLRKKAEDLAIQLDDRGKSGSPKDEWIKRFKNVRGRICGPPP